MHSVKRLGFASGGIVEQFTTRRRREFVVVLVALALTAATLLGVPAPAFADTAPGVGVEETVSGDPLPTAQINGVVWTQAIVGSTVYVGGEFTNARPAGAAPGANTQPRANLMAYNLQTGVMTSWNPGANGVIHAVAGSPDGSRVYVGGSFTTIAGQPRNRIAAFSTATGALLPWAPYTNAQVSAIAASGDSVFIAGSFSSLAGGARTRLGAVSASTGALLPLTVSLTGGYGVRAIVVNPQGTKIVVAGSFESTNGSTNPGRGMAALNASTGALMPWAVNSLIRNAGTSAAMYALASDSDSVYGTGYDYGGGPEDKFEGTFRANWSDGSLVWLEDCHGDNYSVAATSGVVYTASHDHYCGNIGGFPQTDPWSFRHSLAFAKEYHGNVLTADIHGYKSYTGRPAATGLHWYPEWQVGTYTGKSQAVWNVEAEGDYVIFGGEFPRVNNIPQQGLVRFAKKSIAPNTAGPLLSGTSFPVKATSFRSGEVRLSWRANTDPDNRSLTYQVFRQDLGGTPIYTVVGDSNFWTTPLMTFADKTASPGQTYQYRIRATDPLGNQATGAWASVTSSANNQASGYSLSVMDDGPAHYWPLNESSGTAGDDLMGETDLILKGATRNVSGQTLATPSKATQFSGTTSSYASATASESAPQTFSVEAWFKTTSTSGGQIVGMGNRTSGNSTMHDRHLYLNGAGRVTFGVYPGATRVVSSAGGLNNGQWHHVVGTLSPAGMNLYVDGVRVANRTDTTTAQSFTGYWRVGGDNVGGWPNGGSSGYLSGTISDVAVYQKVLTPGQIDAHRVASGRPSALGPNAAPVAGFTSSVSGLTASVDGSSSTDADGTIAAYAWAFGDGATASGVTASHPYAAAGTYMVTLTVTDNAGATNVKTGQVTVTAPPPANAAPVAGFTSSVSGLTASVDGSSSTDADGTIAAYAWAFGDGATASGVTASHPYAAAGTYTVTLTVTDNAGATNVKTGQVTVTAPPPPAGNVLARDLFERTGSNGWGTADQGGAWTVTGTASRYSVAGGAGVITLPNSTAAQTNLLSVSSANTKVAATFSVDKIANGQYVTVIGRQVGADQYLLRARIAGDGTVQLNILRNQVAVGGGITVPGVVVTPGAAYTVVFEVRGTAPTTLSGKLWATGQPEPAAWQVTRTDATAGPLQAAGSVGLTSYVPAAAAVHPVTLSIAELTITDPTIP